MKKLTLLVSALMIAGVTFACDGDKGKKACCKKGTAKKECCKKDSKECSKEGKTAKTEKKA
jgi:hypothetical protein